MPFSEQQLKPVKMSFDKEQGETNCLRSYLREHQVHWILNAGFSYCWRNLWVGGSRVRTGSNIWGIPQTPNNSDLYVMVGSEPYLLAKMSHHSLNSSVFKGKKLHIPPCLFAKVHRMASPSCYVHRCNLRVLKAIELEAKNGRTRHINWVSISHHQDMRYKYI